MFQKLLSYFVPITKKRDSQFNGALEITWYNGKKLLDSKNANYSYGALHKVLRFGLSRIPLESVNSVLILGLGGGSAIQLLRNDFGYNKHITALEIDPIVIEIAKKEFNLFTIQNLEIIKDDALDYVKSTNRNFDVCIIDLFIDQKVPAKFYEIGFWKKISDIIEPGGSILFNAGIQLDNKLILKPVRALLEKKFIVHTHDNVEIHNTLLVANKEKFYNYDKRRVT